MIFADSSFLISLYCEDEERHDRAAELFKEAKNAGERIELTDHVLDEVITFIKKRYGAEKAFNAGSALLNAKQVELIFTSLEQVSEALETTRKYAALSFCDALSVVAMHKTKIAKIYSFDSDFDRMPGVTRVH